MTSKLWTWVSVFVLHLSYHILNSHKSILLQVCWVMGMWYSAPNLLRENSGIGMSRGRWWSSRRGATNTLRLSWTSSMVGWASRGRIMGKLDSLFKRNVLFWSGARHIVSMGRSYRALTVVIGFMEFWCANMMALMWRWIIPNRMRSCMISWSWQGNQQIFTRGWVSIIGDSL